MARDRMYRRYDNGKIQLPYLTLDASLLYAMTNTVKDRALIGEIICAFNEYERGGAETIPTLENKDGQPWLEMLIEKHEMCRDALQAKSETLKKNAGGKDKNVPANEI